MANWAAEANGKSAEQTENLKNQKQEVMARCQRRTQAARRLFKDGDKNEAEYYKILRECEQETESWNQLIGEQEQVEYELKMCVGSLTRLAALCDTSDTEQ
jgi:2-phosphoglycerate kinase